MLEALCRLLEEVRIVREERGDAVTGADRITITHVQEDSRCRVDRRLRMRCQTAISK